MTKIAELKPCPFCGGACEMWNANDGRPAWIACMGRCAVLISKEHKTDAEAIAAWNTRTPDPAVQAPHMTKPRVKPLVWSDPQPPGETSRYNHETAESAVGKYAIEWKSWKDHDWPGLCCEERYIDSFPTIEAAKAAAQADYEARILAALDMTPDPAAQALVDSQRELARWVAAESWRISGLVSDNDEAMRVHVEIGKMFGSLQGAKNPAVQALVEAARALQIDMLERAQMKIDAIHGEQYRIVNAGRSAWSDFCAALAAFDKTD